jgi:HEAT repeat protein
MSLDPESGGAARQRKEVYALMKQFHELLSEKGKESPEVMDFLERAKDNQEFQELAQTVLALEQEIPPPPSAPRKERFIIRALLVFVVLLGIAVGGAFWTLSVAVAAKAASEAKLKAERDAKVASEAKFKAEQAAHAASEAKLKAEQAAHAASEARLKAIADLALQTNKLAKKLADAEEAPYSPGRFVVEFTPNEKADFIQKFDDILKSFAQDYLEMLGSKKVDELKAATYALSRIELDPTQKPKAVRLLIELLGNNNRSVRLGASYALVKIGKEAIVPLVEIWDSGDTTRLPDAIQTLGRIGKEGSLEQPLIQRLAQEVADNGQSRVDAAFALWRINGEKLSSVEVKTGTGGKRGIAEFLATEIGNEKADRDVRIYGMWALGKIAGAKPKAVSSKTIKEIANFVNDKDWNLANGAAEALVEVGPLAVPVLVERLERAKREQRPRLFDILCKVGAKIGGKKPPERDQVIATLLKAIRETGRQDTGRQDSEADAAFALGEMRANDPHVVTALVRLLGDEHNFLTRQNAAIALGKMGLPDAKSALGELVRIFKRDPIEAVREAANSALKKLSECETTDKTQGGNKPFFNKSFDLSQGSVDEKNGRYYQSHDQELSKDMLYRIDLESEEFDPYLFVERKGDKAGVIEERDDDSAGNLNSRVYFRPPEDGVYALRVTTFSARTKGKYTLKIWKFECGSAPTAKNPP